MPRSNAGKDVSSIKRGLVSGAALPPSLRQELSSRGVEVLQCYAVAETGVIAYETPAREGLVVNENTHRRDRAARAPAIRFLTAMSARWS